MPIPLPVTIEGRRPGAHDSAGIRSMQQLVLLRWIAVVGQLLAIVVVHFGIGVALPLKAMLLVVFALCLFNLLGPVYWHRHPRITDRDLLLALLIDVAALTAQLYFSGGIANPFVFLYLLQAVLAAVLLRERSRWLVVAVAGACIAGLSLLHSPVTLPADPKQGLSDPYVQGLLLCFLLLAGLLVVFIGRIGAIVRTRDARLAALRQRAAEEDHIVRMGLLASGAAHELGTPLSTLAVILGDWQHLPHFTSDPELLNDVVEMQAQILRCKAIVTGILQSAGETRGEAPRETTLRAFIDEMVDEWKRSRPAPTLEYANAIPAADDIAIVADTGLKQMLFNVLDNALEASPAWLRLDTSLQGDMLALQIRDHGPGFADDMRQRLGKPYQSSKNAPGRGLGLFLSLNVARSLGGTLRAENPPDGGARVTIALPLQSLLLDQGERDD